MHLSARDTSAAINGSVTPIATTLDQRAHRAHALNGETPRPPPEMAADQEVYQQPVRDSNPCRHLERVVHLGFRVSGGADY